MGILAKDEAAVLEKIRLERDSLVRDRDRLRREAFELTERIFELNFKEESIRSK